MGFLFNGDTKFYWIPGWWNLQKRGNKHTPLHFTYTFDTLPWYLKAHGVMLVNDKSKHDRWINVLIEKDGE